MSLPDRALSNFDIEKAVKNLGIKNFRGTPMRDTLPKKPWKDESGIMNLDRSSGNGSHWIVWVKRGNTKVVFDSYGLAPPDELVRYLGKNVLYNTTQVQEKGYWCGHACVFVLVATNQCNEGNLLKVTQETINKLL